MRFKNIFTATFGVSLRRIHSGQQIGDQNFINNQKRKFILATLLLENNSKGVTTSITGLPDNFNLNKFIDVHRKEVFWNSVFIISKNEIISTNGLDKIKLIGEKPNTIIPFSFTLDELLDFINLDVINLEISNIEGFNSKDNIEIKNQISHNKKYVLNRSL